MDSGPSKKVLVDLRGCQVHQDRGIPAYAQSLVLQLCKDHPRHRYLFFREAGAALPSRTSELSPHGEWRTERDLASDASLHIDVLFTTSFFIDRETHSSVKARGTEYLYPHWLRRHSPLTLGVVYDLIPYLFPDKYLVRPGAREAYNSTLGFMREYDRLFAISEATRADTIRLAGADPYRVRCVYGHIDLRKGELLQAASPGGIPARFGLDRKYLVYVGGDDWRKNMEGLVRAFARFHLNQREFQLALVCKMDDQRKDHYQALAGELGIASGSLVCSGLVSDEELVALIRGAQGMVFPSLYEGLGLPILEAYGCGVPVIGSDRSSIRELVHPDCRFDPESPESIAQAMQRLVSEPVQGEKSLAFGAEILTRMGWGQAAARVAEALDAVPSAVPPPGKPRLAVIGVLPPADTGIARYTFRNLQGGSWTTDFFAVGKTPEDAAGNPGLRPGNRILPIEALPVALRRVGYHHAIFVLGNSPHHEGVLEALFRTRLDPCPRRWVYLHEADLFWLMRAYLGIERDALLDDREALGALDPPGAEWLDRALRTLPGLRSNLCFLRAAGQAHGVIVNSLACRELVRAALGEDSAGWPVEVAFHPMEALSWSQPKAQREDGVLRIGHFGMPGENKQTHLVVDAVERLSRHRPVHLMLAGWGVRRFCRRHRLFNRPYLTWLDSPTDETLAAAMAGVDIGVQLRVPTKGESSGVVGQLLAIGKKVIVTGEGSYAELPEGLVTKVSAKVDGTSLAKAIEAAAEAPVPADAMSAIAAQSQAAFETRIRKILGF